MNYQELQTEIESNKQLLLIDVREPSEYEDALTQENFINIPLEELLKTASQGNLPKDKKIILICSSGKRSQAAAEDLNADGYEAISFDGGISNLTNK